MNQSISHSSWRSSCALSRFHLLWLVLCSLLATGLLGCNSSKTEEKPKAGLTKVALLLNWYPEAEHGGFYAAQVHGIFEKYGLDVEIQAGGKTTVVPQSLSLGRVEFGVANADDVLIARYQGIPLVALMAPIQQGPRCIMVRADSGIKSFEDLKNLTLQIDSGRPYEIGRAHV